MPNSDGPIPTYSAAMPSVFAILQPTVHQIYPIPKAVALFTALPSRRCLHKPPDLFTICASARWNWIIRHTSGV